MLIKRIKKAGIIAVSGICILAAAGVIMVQARHSQGKGTPGQEIELLTDQQVKERIESKYDGASFYEANGKIEEYGDYPVIKKESEQLDSLEPGIDSLETDINDMYVFNGAKEIIVDICEAAGINAENAVIRDLTAEQIIEIEQRAYEKSDHKN